MLFIHDKHCDTSKLVTSISVYQHGFFMSFGMLFMVLLIINLITDCLLGYTDQDLL